MRTSVVPFCFIFIHLCYVNSVQVPADVCANIPTELKDHRLHNGIKFVKRVFDRDEHKKLTLQCNSSTKVSPDANSNPKVTWEHLIGDSTGLTWIKVGLSLDTNVIDLLPVGELQIMGPSPIEDNAGPYRCIFSHQNSTPVYCDVVLQPVIKVEELESLRVKEGEEASFSCDVEAYPTPTISWFKANQSWTPDRTERKNISLVRFRETAFILKADASHRGTYSCVAANSHGTDNLLFYLRVRDPLAALYPGIGIVLLCCLLIGIIAASEFSNRRRKANEANRHDPKESERIIRKDGEPEEE